MRRLKLCRVNGARGWTMFFFGVSAAIFGLAFTGPFKLIPPVPKGLVPVDSLIPLEWWGLVWFFVAGWLVRAAFREDQSKAMGAYATMLAVWALSYFAAGFLADDVRLSTALYFNSALFASILGACLGVARLVNAPPIDVQALVERHQSTHPEGEGDDS